MEGLTQKLENYIEKNHQKGIFLTYIEIENATGIDIHDVIKHIDESDNFRCNRDRKWTTLDMYKKYRGFWDKFWDLNAGVIR